MSAAERVARVGFTGSREGVTDAQRAVLRSLFRAGDHFHHGDCVGADANAAAIAVLSGARIYAHPPADAKLRAYFPTNDHVFPPKDYLERNADIVDATDLLVACPVEDHEVARSGTWSTVRYAVRTGKPVVVVYPDGRMERK